MLDYRDEPDYEGRGYFLESSIATSIGAGVNFIGLMTSLENDAESLPEYAGDTIDVLNTSLSQPSFLEGLQYALEQPEVHGPALFTAGAITTLGGLVGVKKSLSE